MAASSNATRPVFLLRRLLFVSVMLFFSAAFTHFNQEGHHDGGSGKDPALANRHQLKPRKVLLRKILSSVDEGDDVGYNVTEANVTAEPEGECIPPTIHEFPPDYFSNEQREKGAVVLHVFCVIYMFIAIAVVCDDYFVPSLEKICERLGFQEDVAGATFMAAGSSAPELFTSIIGVFIAKGDVGVGTIVGSAVFNILVIIGLCGLFAGQVVPLSWWPLFRDSIIYSLAVVALLLVLYDGSVSWYESLIMLCMYGGYIVIMRFNPQISDWLDQKSEKRRKKRSKKMEENEKCRDGPGCTAVMIPLESVNNTPTASSPDELEDKSQVFMVDEYISNSPKRLTFPDAGLRLMLSSHFTARTRMRSACWMIIAEKNNSQQDPKHVTYVKESSADGRENGDACHSEKDDSKEIEIEDDGGFCTMPKTCFGIAKFMFIWPILLALLTIPDCRKKRWDRWFMATFFISIIWIAAFSYLMVWMVSLIGYTLEIPDTIMGITFLAAGTSVPDAMASLIVARQGLGDMAVSNSIGSNIFDILLGLALPWFLKTTVIDYGSSVVINSKGLRYSVILLFGSVALTVGSIHCNGWKLNKRIGFILMAFYVVFLLFSVLIEFNVLGYVNPPMCHDY